MTSVSTNHSKNAILLLISVIVGLLLSELSLRIIGVQPFYFAGRDLDEPVMYLPDPEVGWINKEGSYLIPPYAPGGSEIQLTFLNRGMRRTHIVPVASDSQIVLVGGSFTQGWAISDAETFAWKLQEKLPSFSVMNFGTGGYGTYQSLLVLERELPHLSSPMFVYYGFIEDHVARNVALSSWLRRLTSFSDRGHIATPYVSVDKHGELVRHAPEQYSSFPLRESSALVTLVEMVYMKLKTWDRIDQIHTTTEQLILEMNRISAEHGAVFKLLFLSQSEETKIRYIAFLQENKIPFIDFGFDISEEMRVPGDSHPNGTVNTIWADQIGVDLETIWRENQARNSSE